MRMVITGIVFLLPLLAEAEYSVGIAAGTAVYTEETAESDGIAILDPSFDGPGAKVVFNYAANRYFEVEAAYLDLNLDNEVLVSYFGLFQLPFHAEVDMHGYSAQAVGVLPLTDRLSLLGKLGLVSWKLEVRLAGLAEQVDGEDAVGTIGLRWRASDKYSVEANYDHGLANTKLLAISGHYHFGRQ